MTGGTACSGPGVVVRLLTAVGLPLSSAACAEVAEEAAPVHEPAVVQPVGGSDLPVVRLEARAADQVGLRTAPARHAGAAAGRATVVPYAALIYDPAGGVWVYTVEEPLAFVRHRVTVARIEGDTAWLRKGPQPGTRVVTRGATEVYGAELGISGGH